MMGTNSGTSGFKLSPIDDATLSESLTLTCSELESLRMRKLRGIGGGGIAARGSATGQKLGCAGDEDSCEEGIWW